MQKSRDNLASEMEKYMTREEVDQAANNFVSHVEEDMRRDEIEEKKVKSPHGVYLSI